MSQEKAFLKAFEEHNDALLRHCFVRVADRERAMDLVQDAFARTWDYIARENEVCEFRPFLYRTLNRLIIDEYRRKKTESLDALMEEGDGIERTHHDLREGGLDELVLQLDAREIATFVASMPHGYQEVLLLRYFDGLSPQEISEVLNEPANTISVRIHRGIAWLRKRIDEQHQ